MFSKILQRIFPKCQPPPILGRWSLKKGCIKEEMAVFNANRDHCGNQEEYKKMAPKSSNK